MQVDLLILDRTFASLDAAAQRLMGAWTKVDITHNSLVNIAK